MTKQQVINMRNDLERRSACDVVKKIKTPENHVNYVNEIHRLQGQDLTAEWLKLGYRSAG